MGFTTVERTSAEELGTSELLKTAKTIETDGLVYGKSEPETIIFDHQIAYLLGVAPVIFPIQFYDGNYGFPGIFPTFSIKNSNIFLFALKPG